MADANIQIINGYVDGIKQTVLLALKLMMLNQELILRGVSESSETLFLLSSTASVKHNYDVGIPWIGLSQ